MTKEQLNNLKVGDTAIYQYKEYWPIRKFTVVRINSFIGPRGSTLDKAATIFFDHGDQRETYEYNDNILSDRYKYVEENNEEII